MAKLTPESTRFPPSSPPAEGNPYLIQFVIQGVQDNPALSTVAMQTQIKAAVGRYTQFYHQRFTRIGLPGMDRPVPLSRIYVPLQVIDERAFRGDQSPKSLKQLNRQRSLRHEDQWVRSLRSGLEVINQKQYLMVLGAPGFGKSTFLRWAGLEALQSNPQGNYRHLCFPVMLPLRYCQGESFSLKQLIIDQFSFCGFPQPDTIAEALLTQGKCLILWDGLDEVHPKSVAALQTALSQFVEQYPKNRYILSCRKAAAYLNLKRFAAVEIAPLNSQQVAIFIRKHLLLFLGVVPDLVVHLKNLSLVLASQSSPVLSWNPLYLMNLCRVYSRTQQLPGNPSSVYREALDLVLEAVDPRRSNLPVLQAATLQADVKKALLSELAHQGLIQQVFIYPEEKFETYIQHFLAETLSSRAKPEAKDLLQELVQQGMLSAIAHPPNLHHYGFTHRSLQEYLAARYLAQYDTPIQPIVKRYGMDLNWREVFIFLSAQVDRSDHLLEELGKVAQQYVRSDRLRQLLQWTHQVTQGAQGTFKPVVKRIVALTIALDRALDMTHSLAIDRALDQVLNLNLDLALLLDKTVAFELDRIVALDLDAAPGGHFDLNYPLSVALELKRLKAFPDGKTAWLISRLEALKNRDMDSAKSTSAKLQEVFQIWIQAFNLKEDLLQLTAEEVQHLQSYLYICVLMEQCRQVAVRVSRRTWERLEAQMIGLAMDSK